MERPKKADVLPFQYALKINVAAEFQSLGTFHQTYKRRMRALYLFISGQHRYHQKKILPPQKKILWLHNTTTNIGDSLMRLSGAALLKTHHQLDLQTIDAVSPLYQTSNIFDGVFSLETVPTQSYDCIIVDALTTRCLKAKKKYYPHIPFVSLYEYFDSFRSQYNIILFSYFRMAELMGAALAQSHIEQIASVEMQVDLNATPSGSTSNRPLSKNEAIQSVGIVCGGNDDWRTYQHFSDVIKEILRQHPSIQIILLGANNGISIAETLIKKYPPLVSMVGKCTVLETAAIIKKLDLLVTPDGGLMHIANALNVPIVALFARIDPTLRLTARNQASTLYDAQDVNNISAHDVSAQLQLIINNY